LLTRRIAHAQFNACGDVGCAGAMRRRSTPLIGGTSGCSTHAEKIINCSVLAVHQTRPRICISTCHFGAVIHAIVVAGSRCIDSGPV